MSCDITKFKFKFFFIQISKFDGRTQVQGQIMVKDQGHIKIIYERELWP